MPLSMAVKICRRLNPELGAGWHQIHSGDIAQLEIIGPDGWDGCRRAMNHSMVFEENPVETGPNAGRTSRSGKCTLCGGYKFEWTDGLP